MNKYLLILISLVLMSSSLFAKEKITWHVVHWPPFQMLDGVDKGKGRFDALLNLFRENLPQYEHETLRMNWARFFNDVKKGEKVCSIFIIKTDERETFAEFSKIVTFNFPIRIIMRKSTIRELGNPDSLSIVDMLENSRFKGVIESKRSYTPQIDTLLLKHKANISPRPIQARNIIQMLVSGRTDYTIEYPYTANYLAKEFQSDYPAELGSIEIKELSNFLISHFACPKNEWGHEVVKDFDTMLKKVRPTPEYLKIMKMWHTDPQEIEVIESTFREMFLKGNQE